MNNPWDVRPKADKGDNTAEPLFLKVGEALTAWEGLESTMAELFDVLVASQPSNRAAFVAFIAVKTSSARTELLEAAYKRALPAGHGARQDVKDLIHAFGKFGARRNEIAHGRVYDLGDGGYYLGPNNVMAHKWTETGSAKYQFTSVDLSHYVAWFVQLNERASGIIEALRHLAASSSTNRTRSEQNGRGRRT